MAGKQLRKVRNPITGDYSLTDPDTGLPDELDTTVDPTTAVPPPRDPTPAAEIASHQEADTGTDSDPVDNLLLSTQDSAVDLARTIAKSPVSRGVVSGNYDRKSDRPSTYKIDTLTAQLAQLKKADLPEDNNDWDAKIAQAQQMKSEGASRAAWANLAQIIGEGLVKVAAARDARAHGIAPVEIHGGPSAYKSLIDQNEADYRDQIDAINHSHQYNQQQRNELITKAERDHDDARKSLEDQIGAERFKYGEDVRQTERGEDRSERARMHAESLAAQNARTGARAGEQEQAQAFRDAETERKTQLGQVNQALKHILDQRKAAEQLAAKLNTYDDLPSKDQKHFADKNAALLGKAGVDESSLQAFLEPEGTGFFSRTFGEGKDPAAARKEMIQQKIMAPLQAQEKDLLDQRNQLSQVSSRTSSVPSTDFSPATGPGNREAGPAPTTSGAGPATGGLVRMVDPKTGQEYMLPAHNVSKAEARGYVRK